MNQKLIKKILRVSLRANSCHIGSALSCIGIIKYIYSIKRRDDIFIFGKASGISAWLCYKYPFKKSVELLKKYPLPSKEVGLPWTGGSIGQSLSVACGMALADKTRNVFILLGDADIQEGQTYEALLFARQHKLKNLKIYVDRNRLQALGNTEDILGIDQALMSLKDIFPIKVYQTIKGNGVRFLEEMGYKNHYFNLNKDGYKRAIHQLAGKKIKKR